MKRKFRILLTMAKHPFFTWKYRHCRKALGSVGISLYDENGDMKSLLVVLEQMAEKWADVGCEDDE